MRVHWIWLATRPHLTDRVRQQLIERFQDAEDVYFAESGSFQDVELTKEAAASLADKDLKDAQKILDTCLDKDIDVVTYRDAAYPARLKSIADPPLVLYIRGKLLDFDGLPLLAVVGTRKASGYGLTTAKRMGYQIAACGGVVVSGAASGIDSVAMAGALSAGAPVIGVLGCGADVVYPRSSKSLYTDTAAAGCLLTEYPPGTPPHRWHFPRRNRIISGLSNGVLVVEAPKGSGALITARQAADQGRDVFVVPGNIDTASCVGSNALLRDGAIAVTCGWDVMEEYVHHFPDKIHKYTAAVNLTLTEAELPQERPEPKVAQKPRLLGRKKESPQPEEKKPLPALTELEAKIVEQIIQGNTLVDDIISALGQNAGGVLSALTVLQIKGITESLPGKRVRLKEK